VILIVTNRADHTADWLILELERRSAPFFRFNTEDFPSATFLDWTPDDARLAMSAGRRLELRDVRSVWYRRPIPPEPSAWDTPERARWAIGEARETLEGLWRTLDAFWVNHPDMNRVAGSKLHQLRHARRIGFPIPATLVSNDANQVREFAARHAAEGIVCKPLGEGRLDLTEGERLFFTSRFDLTKEDDLSDLGPEPYLFQELVAKRYDLRVTVIGDEVFAVRIESQQSAARDVDWRRAGAAQPHIIEELPTDVAAKCRSMTHAYALEFAAIDLLRTEDGEHVFLELNPNGQWAWLEQLTGQPLSSCLADLLERGSRC
jgi:MvdD pre-ATP grasp domain/RimK-like ATP-grasp domain